MIFRVDNKKLHKDMLSNSSVSDDALLSLLQRRPLPSLRGMAVSSSSYATQALSFEDPFDDPSMEPMPLGPNTARARQAPSLKPIEVDNVLSSESLFLAEDCLSAASTTTMELNNPLPLAALNTNLREDLRSSSDPAMDSNKRTRRSDEIFSNQDPRKRQRTSPLVAAAPDEARRARFRPYHEQQWRVIFQKLVQYKVENGHCSVPHSYSEDPILARWVKRQRYQFKKLKNCDPTSTMTTRRLQELKSIGFVWHSHESSWHKKLNELKVFKKEKGHCHVPSHYPENARLAAWVKCQRRHYKLFTSGSSSSTMTIERLRELESLGFAFDLSRRKP
ncbi:MAG: hypothetical protein SGBAC_005340 [Bacillariaceae sp.]